MLVKTLPITNLGLDFPVQSGQHKVALKQQKMANGEFPPGREALCWHTVDGGGCSAATPPSPPMPSVRGNGRCTRGMAWAGPEGEGGYQSGGLIYYIQSSRDLRPVV